MVLPYDPRLVDEAGRHFDETVRRIQEQEFQVKTPPEAAICKECDCGCFATRTASFREAPGLMASTTYPFRADNERRYGRTLARIARCLSDRL